MTTPLELLIRILYENAGMTAFKNDVQIVEAAFLESVTAGSRYEAMMMGGGESGQHHIDRNWGVGGGF